jgi:thiol-disulfide isomerase/thioredoxin
MKTRHHLLCLAFALPLIGCASAAYSAAESAEPHSWNSEETRVYDSSRDADADVTAALSRVAGTERKVIVSMGANWCHDSRGLVEHLGKPEVAPLIAANYEVVYVDVGRPQKGEGRNAELAERFGVAPLVGTPTVVILDAQGMVLNREDAPSWRNAHSRTTEEVREYFAGFVAE